MMRGITSEVAEEVAEFLIDRDAAYHNAVPFNVRMMIEWYAERQALGLINQGGKLVGVGLARPVLKDEVGKDAWDWNDFGDTIFIQEIAADRADAIPALWGMMVGRFGRRAYVAGKRHGKAKVWPFEVYEKKMTILEQQQKVRVR